MHSSLNIAESKKNKKVISFIISMILGADRGRISWEKFDLFICLLAGYTQYNYVTM